MNAVGLSSASDQGAFTQRVATGQGTSIGSRPAEPVFDVGIVLADRPGYLCLPFEQVGLPVAAQVEHLRASCECIDPRVVKIIDDRGDVVPALLLEFVPEPASGVTASTDGSAATSVGSAPPSALQLPRGQNLGVIVDVALSDGAMHRFRVDLLHTHLHEEGQR
ncbi:MAG: hypothetical protein KatS3mg111_3462 [Pirellulaceae bacterium]|nr:MAG: hypothetical protein KatS3mg111_3462 [Pirellulaceae bacterium]